jgi:hypothetical protein
VNSGAPEGSAVLGINFVTDFQQVGVSPVSSPNKTDCHDITEILLKVALNN